MVDKKGNSQRNIFNANGTAEGEGEKTVHGAELSRESGIWLSQDSTEIRCIQKFC